MKLIWTYTSNVIFGNEMGKHTPERIRILINYYIHSIQSAKNLGYYTIIYCDERSKYYFNNIVDEIITINSNEKSPLWDWVKIKVLEERNDDFCLIDGDIILHSKLPKFTTDITFDSYEINNFKHNYKSILNDLTDMGISNEIPIWQNIQLPIISCGLLNIKNKELKQNYIYNWKLYNEFIKPHIDKVDIDCATMVGAQYLLSILALGLTHTKLSNLVGIDNPYYKHHCGPVKYNNPIVPTNRIITDMKKMLF